MHKIFLIGIKLDRDIKFILFSSANNKYKLEIRREELRQSKNYKLNPWSLMKNDFYIPQIKIANDKTIQCHPSYKEVCKQIRSLTVINNFSFVSGQFSDSFYPTYISFAKVTISL